MDAVTSTMDVARHLESLGSPEGTTVIAASQTRGRGRSGRTWQSPPGAGIYCSIVLRPRLPADQFRPVSIAAGLAICDALDPDKRLALQLKWPNDIIVQDRKLAGILITTALSGPVVDSAILGIGVNLRSTGGLLETAIALSDITPDDRQNSTQLTSAILHALSRRYDLICNHQLEAALAGWPDRLAFLHQLVSLQDGARSMTGTVEGIDTGGSLILRTAHGTEIVASGELVRGPRKRPTLS